MSGSTRPTITTYEDAAAQAAINSAAALATRQRIAQAEGGIEAFRRNVYIEHLGDPEVGDLDEFHSVLRRGILPSELVPLNDFIAALGPKNDDHSFQEAIGPYRYFGLALRTASGAIIGAAGFAVFCHHVGPATLHASYYALLPHFRGLGLLRFLLNEVSRTAIRFIAETRPAAFGEGPVVEFLEANDFAHMTLADRLLDEAIAMHPLARDALWERMNFREIMDINYHQRGAPPIKLMLKATLIDVAFTRGYYHTCGRRPPTFMQGDIVARHVSAFDDLLMNYDQAKCDLRHGHRLPDVTVAGLLDEIMPGTILFVKSPDQAARDRKEWEAIDQQLSLQTGLAVNKTMCTLRNGIDRIAR